jgi:hypothetical protein
MNREQMVADELRKMYLEGNMQITVEEDMNHLAQRLRNGEVDLNNLQNEDLFVQEKLKEALSRIENKQ